MDSCVEQFMQNHGCVCWSDDSCDYMNLIPPGCGSCSDEAAQACIDHSRSYTIQFPNIDGRISDAQVYQADINRYASSLIESFENYNGLPIGSAELTTRFITDSVVTDSVELT